MCLLITTNTTESRNLWLGQELAYSPQESSFLVPTYVRAFDAMLLQLYDLDYLLEELDRTTHPIEQYLDPAIITNGLMKAFSTGSWAHSYKSWEKTSSVVAFIRRVTPLQMVCDMRRTRQQVLYDREAGDARYLKCKVKRVQPAKHRTKAQAAMLFTSGKMTNSHCGTSGAAAPPVAIEAAKE
ncbi:DNA-directed RNA polymerases IV and V subunit 2-like protein [Tanacetum coccineum]|uniref:DNA-directed RNA polymerases IV and V subunit 2-like protein n=1 Tax=Tanacetum coccineum TaxID=301880 RepID=A0ABQ4YNL7_9ASTR